MIFRRPYAFLIKYFKIINFVISLLFIYIAYKSYRVMTFFNEYVTHNYSGNIYKNFYMQYISPITILAFIVLLIGLAIVLWLLIYKKKPIKIYATSILYYFILLIYFTINKNVMIGMETSVVTAEAARIYRDLSLIFLVPQIFFIITFILRGFGLNINKFNFEKDIKELEVTSEDNEEVELTFKNDGVKLKRNIRRYFREFSYYLKENKLIVSIIGAILTILLVILIINLFPKKVDSNYKQGNIFTYDNITYSLKDSIITNLNYQGDLISKNKYYLVVVLNIKNNSIEDKSLDYNNFRLELDNDNIYPILDKGLNFVDYAEYYSGSVINGNNSFDYSLVFELNKNDIRNNYKIKFASGSTLKDNNIVGKFNIITITPSIINKVNNTGNYNLNEEVSFINSNLGNSSIKFNNPLITNKYVYNYESCYNNKCSTYKDIVNLDYTKTNKALLVLDYEYNIDKNVPFYKTSQTINGFINYFIKVKYTIDSKEYYSNVSNSTPSKLNGKIVLETTDKINEADNIYLSLIIRNKEYLVTIK